MRLMVFFDLPTSSYQERHNYANFRRFLIQDGYEMIQYSVYGRITANHDDAAKHLKRLNLNLPPQGSVRALLITEKQYAAMKILVGKQTASEKLLADHELIEL